MDLDIENIWEEICNDLGVNLNQYEEYLISWDDNKIEEETFLINSWECNKIEEQTFLTNNKISTKRNDGKKEESKNEIMEEIIMSGKFTLNSDGIIEELLCTENMEEIEITFRSN